MNYLRPQQSLNKAFLKVKLTRDELNLFKVNLHLLLTQTNQNESEEYNKNLLRDFLVNTYYQDQFLINTKDKNDLVIYKGKNNTFPVNVIFETKKVSDKKDFPKLDNLNCKALQQLLYYYLQERVINKNLEVKYLIITNNIQWFIFDAQIFENFFINDKTLIKQFTDFSENRLTGKKTDYFYQQIAFPVIENVKNNLIFTYLNLTEYQDILLTALSPQPPLPTGEGEKLALEKKLIPLYKIFTPEHLLKLSFANDSNSLNKAFYSELLYVLGLTEVKEGNKKLIQREKEGNRNQGSLLENALSQIKSLDKLERLENLEVLEKYGENEEDQLFNLGLELIITWINRILFLKLLEAKLISYHSQDQFSQFAFLNINKINNYEELNSLFFQVLACKIEERETNINQKWGNIPYLNSSLFEVTEIEHQTIVISNLKTENLPIFKFSVLKDSQGKKLEGKLNCLEYLFNFLDSYDFGETDFDPPPPPLKRGELEQNIQEIPPFLRGARGDQKSLINASVLGLIFEKINGYKDGSFFTPGFITMYMCKETIRRAVIQKFNDVKNWNCQNIDDLYNKIEDKKEANTIINSLKICDPAVGSGHFLVSALNEIIAIKSELKILLDKNGKTLRDYQITVENDELIIINEDGEFFTYNPNNQESQRVQETLFHEKQTIIENCLFGVDINSNSVKICRLRLWIELLKNSYYNENQILDFLEKSGIYRQLETLPNIDINIKVGNSLISRFPLSNQALISAVTKKKIIKLQNEIDKLNTEIEEIDRGKLYQNAFEWRFEFPEVLNDQGDFIGFDIIIGNPPYGVSIKGKERDYLIINKGKVPDFEIYYWFINLANSLLKDNGKFSYIIPNSILFNVFAQNYRLELFNNWDINEILDCTDLNIFPEATVKNIIISLSKAKNTKFLNYKNTEKVRNFEDLINRELLSINQDLVRQNNQNWGLLFKLSQNIISLITKIKLNSQPLINCFPETSQGLIAYDKYKNQSEEIIKNRIFHSTKKLNDNYKYWLYGEDLTKYNVKWNGKEYINYCDKIANPREPKFFVNKRILIREITNPSIFATLTREEFYHDPAIIIILDQPQGNLSLECLLGIFNSKLTTFYHVNSSPKATKGAFPKILVYDINNFPLPKYINNNLEFMICEKVEKILKIKKNDPNTDTSKLEKEIDLLVYKLYDLTEDEIKIVEGD